MSYTAALSGGEASQGWGAGQAAALSSVRVGSASLLL